MTASLLNKKPLRAVLWLLALGLFLAPLIGESERAAGAPRVSASPLSKLLGPFSDLAARFQWVRVQHAVLEGSPELALARAETALQLDPGATEGWRFVAVYLGLDLASPNRELSAERRRELILAALDVLRRGEASARAPDQLRFWAGILLMTHAEIDPDLDWPGGSDELWLETARAFERAAGFGVEDASELALQARARANSRR